MTEKRFKLNPYNDFTYGLFDKEKLEYVVEHLPIRFENLCDLLNELAEENKHLKKPIKQVLFNINNLIDKYASNSDKVSVLLELKEIMIDDFGEEIL